MTIGTKVYVSDWGKYYSSFYIFNKGIKQLLFNWNTELPSYHEFMWTIQSHWEHVYIPRLTKKGVPFANGDKVLISSYPKYKDYEYTILESIKNNEGEIIYLLKSVEGCFIQIGAGGITTMTTEEFEKAKKLEKSVHLQVLAKNNFGKWSITDNKKDFPKELLKYIYDVNQNTLFGSTTVKAIIKYPYIAKQYTKNGNDICLGWEQDFNGIGIDLTDKEVISWEQMPKRFPENKFN